MNRPAELPHFTRPEFQSSSGAIEADAVIVGAGPVGLFQVFE
ncbi:ferredoxin--NADP(+) reductase, partial [Acinetobacter baumannii]|nr:ferredoxin--NADP(+) reductase [Acinetobacter baumannii]